MFFLRTCYNLKSAEKYLAKEVISILQDESISLKLSSSDIKKLLALEYAKAQIAKGATPGEIWAIYKSALDEIKESSNEIRD